MDIDEHGVVAPENMVISNNTGTIDTVDITKEVTTETASTDREKMIELLKKQPKITQKEIHERMGISLRSVKRMMAELQKLEKVVRIGNNRSGYWKVME